MTGHVTLHFNAGLEYGMGHLMRSIAVGEMATRQGWSVSIVGDLDDVATARSAELLPNAIATQITRSNQPRRLAETVASLAPDVVHIDSYWPESDALVLPQWFVSNMQDGPFGLRRADLAVDANLGSESWFASPGMSSRVMAGASSTLIRSQVLRRREESRPPSSRLKVLIVIGGTDPHRITPTIVRSFQLQNFSHDFTVVAPPAVSDEVRGLLRKSKSRMTVVPFSEDLPGIAAVHDFVITGAGTSAWDFACMGLPTALVCVTDNQLLGYRAATAAGIGVPLGEPPYDDLEERVGSLVAILDSPNVLAAMRRRALSLIDGLGSWRVVSAWEPAFVSKVNAHVISARRATLEDAQLLLSWRNDAAARSMSRSTSEVTWDEHRAWLARAVQDPERLLLVAEDAGRPVGTVRWDRRSHTDWEVSISVSPSLRGRGYGPSLLAAAEAFLLEDHLPARLIATIHEDNKASERLFARAGYQPFQPVDGDGFAQCSRLVLTRQAPAVAPPKVDA